MLKAIEPAVPLTSKRMPFLRPAQKREASIVPSAPQSNSTVAANASSTSTSTPSRTGLNVRSVPDTVATSSTR